VLVLVSESAVFTQQLPADVNRIKQHSVVPLGGVIVGSGMLPSSEPSPKKMKTQDNVSGTKNVMIALNSYKAIHNNLVEQFERKSFAH
jgi:hypothetical protein